MLSFPISNICHVAFDLDDSAAVLDPKYVLTLLLLDFAKLDLRDLSSFFRDWYSPVTKKVGMIFKRKKNGDNIHYERWWLMILVNEETYSLLNDKVSHLSLDHYQHLLKVLEIKSKITSTKINTKWILAGNRIYSFSCVSDTREPWKIAKEL